MNSDRIPNFDIQVSTLENSIGITSMNWIQAQTERCVPVLLTTSNLI